MLEDKENGVDLYKHLRHQNKKYRKRYGSPKRQGPIKNKVMIDDRPSVVRIGDWEIDTIVGKEHQQAILSVVDRASKYTLLKKTRV